MRAVAIGVVGSAGARMHVKVRTVRAMWAERTVLALGALGDAVVVVAIGVVVVVGIEATIGAMRAMGTMWVIVSARAHARVSTTRRRRRRCCESRLQWRRRRW